MVLHDKPECIWFYTIHLSVYGFTRFFTASITVRIRVLETLRTADQNVSSVLLINKH